MAAQGIFAGCNRCTTSDIICNPPKYCYLAKTKITKYSGCVLVAFVIQLQSACAVLCHLWPVQMYSNFFRNHLINGMVCGKALLNEYFYLNFSVSKVCNSKYNSTNIWWQMYIILHENIGFFCQSLTEIKFCRRI
jgi:hypothetical protein